MTDTVADVLTRVAATNQRIGGLLINALNDGDEREQAGRLREIGRCLGALAAECLARAAECDGIAITTPERVVIDARSEP